MALETHQMLKRAFGKEAMGQTQTYEWFKRFKNSRTSPGDDECSGHPSTGININDENVAKIRQKIHEVRHQTRLFRRR